MDKIYTQYILLFFSTFILLRCSDNNIIDPGEAGNNPVYSPLSVIDSTSAGINFAFVPRMELLAGVLSQTSWVNQRGPVGYGNSYFRDLKAFFEPWKSHKAIQIAETFTRNKFYYDGPPSLIMSMGPLPDLNAPDRYNSSLIDRAGGEEQIENFRKALIDLSEKSDFLSWFQTQRVSFFNCLDTLLTGFHGENISVWIVNFFGWGGNVFHCVLAPAMFPAGGYGFNCIHGDTMHVFCILRETGISQNEAQFPSNHLPYLCIHEFCHSFVNPSVNAHNELISKYSLQDLFNSVRDTMKMQAYNDAETFFNETLVRSITIEALCELNPLTNRNELIRQEAKYGFHLIEFTLSKLTDYRMNRDKYIDFKQFVPVLFKAYHDNKKQFLYFN